MATYPISIYEHRRVKEIKNAKEKIKEIVMEDGETIHAKYIVVTTGAKWRELNIPGEKEYLGKGVAFCPHCDGPYYKGKKIAVIGGGNSGVEAAIDLAGIVKEVTVFEFQDNLKADKVLVDKLNSLSNTSIITNAQTKVIHGDGQKVNALEYINRTNNKEEKMELDGVFVQIGLLPNSQFLKGTLELSKFGEIIIDEKGRTSIPGIYAAGDITTIPYKQIIIAMGEGAKAALALFEDDMKM
jgi:alkyl hydroperoxide reductase subunit F